MIISYNTAFSNFTLNNGFGRAGWGIINSLKNLGHEVGFNYSKAPVELTFAQPEYFESRPHKYQIILCPWESTVLPPRWVEKFHEADEVWATSQWVADVYKAAGVENVTQVYEHGIEKRYAPKLKRRRGPIKFVHLGEPAVRKGGQEALDAFREAFKDNPKRATLTIKAYQRSHVRWFDQHGRIRAPEELPNVNVVREQFDMEELVSFTNLFHASVYPSAGEGFGFIPLETLAQGTPTLSTYDWAPYKRYIQLPIEADQVESKWEFEHPGLIYQPKQESIVERMLELEDDYDNIARSHFTSAFSLHNDYNWDILTQNAFSGVVNRFG